MTQPNHTYRHLQHPTESFSQLRIKALEKEVKRLREKINQLEKAA